MGKVTGLGIALVKHLCPVCLNPEESIIMNNRLTEKNAKEIESMHNKNVGYTKEPCDQCKDWMKQGIVVIGVDVNKSTDESMYRSGHISVVKENVIRDIIEIPEGQRVISMCHEMGLKLGILKNKEQ